MLYSSFRPIERLKFWIIEKKELGIEKLEREKSEHLEDIEARIAEKESQLEAILRRMEKSNSKLDSLERDIEKGK